MKKIAVTIAASAALVLALAGCSGGTASSTSSSTETSSSAATVSAAESTDVAMQYITPDDLQADIDEGSEDLVIVDVRKAADYEAGHITGAINADMDAAVGGDADAGTTAMSEALEEATGSETGGDNTLVLVCYSGKSYAQAGTNALSSLGAEMSNVYTLEGGMQAWTGETTTD